MVSDSVKILCKYGKFCVVWDPALGFELPGLRFRAYLKP